MKLGNLQFPGPCPSGCLSLPAPHPTSPWPLHTLLQQGPGGPRHQGFGTISLAEPELTGGKTMKVLVSEMLGRGGGAETEEG